MVTFAVKPVLQSLLTEYVTWHCVVDVALAVPGTRSAAVADPAASAVPATALIAALSLVDMSLLRRADSSRGT
jgi:hypothetical protein